MHEMPVRWEPVLAIVRLGESRRSSTITGRKIVAHWRELQAAGKIKGFFHAPPALCLSPDWMETKSATVERHQFPQQHARH